MTENSLLREFQSTLEERLQSDFRFLRSLIKHNGERGRLVEVAFQRILERHLPEGFGLVTGFAIDQHGSLSKQIDLMVYRKDHTPFLLNDVVSVLPIEGVVAAIETKSKLRMKEFQDARVKARSLIDLDRSAVLASTKSSQFSLGGNDVTQAGPPFICASIESADTAEILRSLKGQNIEPMFISMDGKCLLNGIGPSGVTGWCHAVDLPASCFVLLIEMIVTRSEMPIIDFSKYMKVRPTV